MRRRIVLNCWGSFGDLFPYLRIAAGLKARGHAPVLATCAFYRDIVEREGIEFCAIAPDVDPTDRELLARVMDPARGTEVIVAELLGPAVRQAFAELSDAVAGADLLVTHPVAFAGPLVGESRRMPWLSTVLAPASFFSVHDFPLLPPHPSVLRLARLGPVLARGFMTIARRVTGPWTRPVREFARELGLPDRGDPLYEGQFSPHGTLALFSPRFAAPQADWPPHTTATGFCFDNADAPLDPELAAFLDAGDPPIVFTLGSSAVGAAGAFYRESIAAAAALGRRAVVLVGRDPQNLDGLDLPATARAVDYAPHAPLFRRAVAIVHHGGVGTTAEALRSGRPMLVVPHAHDQPDNAFRVERLGVGRSLDARRYNAARAARELGALLHGKSYVRTADALGREISAERGVDAACDRILSHGQT